eukprot:6979074-Lingulodinium_polyedra.AAC.1
MQHWKSCLAPIHRMNSSSGEYLYQSVRDNKYALVVIELPDVQFGSSRRDRVRYSAVSQPARDSVRNAVPFLCFGKKGS